MLHTIRHPLGARRFHRAATVIAFAVLGAACSSDDAAGPVESTATEDVSSSSMVDTSPASTPVVSTPATTASTTMAELILTFNDADNTSPPSELPTPDGSNANLTVVGGKVKSLVTGGHANLLSPHGINLSGDWELVVQGYDARCGTQAGGGNIEIDLLNPADFAGVGIFIGDTRAGPNSANGLSQDALAVEHIRVRAPGGAPSNLTNIRSLDNAGTMRLTHDDSANRIQAWRWDPATTTFLQSGQFYTPGTQAGSLLYVYMRKDSDGVADGFECNIDQLELRDSISPAFQPPHR